MKIITKILFIAAICIAFSTSQAVAQKKRADKTSSAKAYYGQTPAKKKHKYKAKKSKMTKSYRSQSMKRARAEARNRKKYS